VGIGDRAAVVNMGSAKSPDQARRCAHTVGRLSRVRLVCGVNDFDDAAPMGERYPLILRSNRFIRSFASGSCESAASSVVAERERSGTPSPACACASSSPVSDAGLPGPGNSPGACGSRSVAASCAA
jgi:hypothetical protein